MARHRANWPGCGHDFDMTWLFSTSQRNVFLNTKFHLKNTVLSFPDLSSVVKMSLFHTLRSISSATFTQNESPHSALLKELRSIKNHLKCPNVACFATQIAIFLREPNCLSPTEKRPRGQKFSWYQIIKLSKKGVIFLWLKHCFGLQNAGEHTSAT